MRSFKPFGLALAVHLALATGFGSVSALAQTNSQWDSLYDRIIRLEHRLREVESGGGYKTDSAASDPASTAQTALRLDRLESDLRTLLGQVQELSHQIKLLNSRLKQSRSDRGTTTNRTAAATDTDTDTESLTDENGYKLPNYGDLSTLGTYPEDAEGGDVNETVGDLNGAEGPKVLGTIPQTAVEGEQAALGAVPDPVEAQPLDGGVADGPDSLYENSYNNMLQRRFGAAEQGFRRFIKDHGKHKLAGNAQYWLGETYYARGRYKQAAKAFLEGYRKYAKSPKAPDSLLKLGMSLNQLGQKQHACKTFAQVKRQFPKASANVKNLAKKEQRRSGCKA